MRQWYYSSGGQQAGPVSGDDLKRLAASGQLQREDLVWSDGMPEWVAAKTLSTLWGNAPGAGAPAAAAPAPAAYAAPALAAYAAPAPAAYAAPAYQAPAAYGQPGQPLQYQSPGQESLYVSPRMMTALTQTKPWVRLFAIIGFLAVGIIVLLALGQIVMAVAFSSSRSSIGGTAAGMGMVMAILTLAIASLYFFPAMFLWRYASRINAVVTLRRQNDLELALESQKSYWKFMGILVVVVICVYLALLLFAVVGASSMSRRF